MIQHLRAGRRKPGTLATRREAIRQPYIEVMGCHSDHRGHAAPQAALPRLPRATASATSTNSRPAAGNDTTEARAALSEATARAGASCAPWSWSVTAGCVSPACSRVSPPRRTPLTTSPPRPRAATTAPATSGRSAGHATRPRPSRRPPRPSTAMPEGGGGGRISTSWRRKDRRRSQFFIPAEYEVPGVAEEAAPWQAPARAGASRSPAT